MATSFVTSCLAAADIELSGTRQLTMSHSLDWVRWKVSDDQKGHVDTILDEINWGTPSGKKIVRNWDFRLSDDDWANLVAQHGAAPEEEATFDLWVPSDTKVVRGVVAISSHGSGKALFERSDLRQMARELDLALFRFVGNPVQRGFWPRSLLFDMLEDFGKKSGHPELANAPLFLYGHSNGTGFSALFTSAASERVWAWVSMRPGSTYQVFQPRAAQVPGLVIFGEDDQFFARPSVKENLSIIPLVRKEYDAVWNFAVEAHTGHGPGENTWPLVLSFLRNSFEARVPSGADPRSGPVALNPLDVEAGYRGEAWSEEVGGYQDLEIAPANDFKGDAAAASWLLNADYANDWHQFQLEGKIN
ncbi:hypothetical protein [Coraliomargarita parva]|uniref:hypothetical protein n=1 Tax=Coraliomargarita parva TaxID=3014050 RepID=UPI0022B3623C|nr:hypothetical protein [Coraliomargarita parva]